MAPRKVAAAFSLPDSLKIDFIKGESFIRAKQAARLAGIHPAILEMGQKLLQSVDGQAGVFVLGSQEMKTRAREIEELFVKGLRKVGRAFGSGVTVKSSREGDRLLFWYAPGWGKAAKHTGA
jgi:hypothetical protein